MHASFASITTEVDIEPTLVMLGLDFDDQDDDDAPTRQVAPPSEVLGYEASGPATQSIPPESVPVIHVSSLSTLAPTSMSTTETTAERPVFALELLPLRPSALAVVGRAIVRWSPWALLGATTGLLLCVGVTRFVDSVSPTKSAAAANMVVAVAPAAPKPTPPAPAALQVAPAPATFIELDDVRPASTVAHRARPAAPAVRAAVRAPLAAPPPAAPAARPVLAAMPSEYRTAR